MKVILIHNPDAGMERWIDAAQLLGMLRAAGYEVTYQSTKERDWCKVLDKPADLVAVAGGDGIVGRVAKRCVGKQVPIAILPLGTANNIARSLGLMDVPLATLAKAWPASPRVKIDIGCATGPWGTSDFLEGIGVGLFTDVMARLDVHRNRAFARVKNRIATVHQVLRGTLRKFSPFGMAVTLDGRDLSGDFIMLEVLNTQSVGPILHLAPEADPGDGQLDVVCFYQGDQMELIQHFAQGDLRERSSGHAPLRGFRLTMHSVEMPIHIDDEILSATTGIGPGVDGAVSVGLKNAQTVFLGYARQGVAVIAPG